MKVELDRLLEGIMATLRNDVIPYIDDAYARGQAVGVIDLLNNAGPRIEWVRAPIVEAVSEKRELLSKVRSLVPDAIDDDWLTPMSVSDPRSERDRLDGCIGDALARIYPDRSAAGREALLLIRKHLHDELDREVKATKKPLFGEIAKGASERADPSQ